MAYGHKEILEKHREIHDKWLDVLLEKARSGDIKKTYAILGYVEREYDIICKVEDRAAAAGTLDEKDGDVKQIGWDELDAD